MVNERLKRIAQAAGIENKKVTFHTARHSDFYFHLKMSRL
jgi:site-specific recombinase XerD